MDKATIPTPVREQPSPEGTGLPSPEDNGPQFRRTDVPTEPQQVPQEDGSEIAQEDMSKYDRRRASRGPGTDRRGTPRTPKAHLFVTLCHWGMVTLLTLNLLSGMRIGWGYLGSPLFGGPTGTLATVTRAIAPKGTLWWVNLMTFHVTSAFLMLLVTGVYLVYLFGTPAWHRLRVTLKDWQNLTLTGLQVNGFWRYKQAVWSAPCSSTGCLSS